MTDRQKLRLIIVRFVEKYEQEKKVTQIEAYEACDGWARVIFKCDAFASYEAFRQFKTRCNPSQVDALFGKMSQTEKMSHEIDEFARLFEEYENSVPLIERVGGMRLVDRDPERPLSKRGADEDDELLNSEEIVFYESLVGLLKERGRTLRDNEAKFLREVCNILTTKPTPKKKWTMEQIRADCAKRRNVAASNFSQELQEA